MRPSEDESILERLMDTIEQAPEDVQARVLHALAEVESGKGSDDTLFAALPDHKLRGALFPHDTWRHWLFTLVAAALCFTFFAVLGLEGSAAPHHVLAVGLFTATVGIVFLLIVQAVALATQNVIIIPRGLIGILFWIVKLIGFSYRAAADPDNGFLLSFLGYTLGVGLCEELCKAFPVVMRYHTPREDSWRSAYLWGLASGAGFGLAEGVIYASDFYNGVHGIGIYLVRNISCVALHAIWTGSAAIMIYRKQHWFQEEMPWHDRVARWIFVVAVPVVLHGLYDTLLKKDQNAGALVVALLSFGYLAFQISRLRSGDDQAANEAMLREYQRRKNTMPAR
jgi:RsiW-degrading membrane proteinase PrsW (M82 family)